LVDHRARRDQRDRSSTAPCRPPRDLDLPAPGEYLDSGNGTAETWDPQRDGTGPGRRAAARRWAGGEQDRASIANPPCRPTGELRLQPASDNWAEHDQVDSTAATSARGSGTSSAVG